MLGGEDPFLFPLVVMGGAGAICASAHVCTERFVAMIECALAGKLDDGRAHAEALLPVVQSLFAEPNPAVFKGVLHAQGRIPTPDVRLPLLNASDEAVQASLALRQRRFLTALGFRPARIATLSNETVVFRNLRV